MLKVLQMEKLPLGIPGLDIICEGGLPRGRTTLVCGTSGSGKTVMAVQFLAEGIARFDQPGVLVTFEEPPQEIRRNVQGFGWDLAEWEASGRLAIVDVSPRPEAREVIAGEYDLGALMARITHAVRRVGAVRLSMDSLGALLTRAPDFGVVRSEMLRIVETFRDLGLTALITSERIQEYGEVARFGVEEFVCDNVILLRNVLLEEKRRRTVEILKVRGANHQKGEFPFSVQPGQGMVVIPLSAVELTQASSSVRIPSGVPEVDEMCGGGFFRDSIVLVSGATGTGKTLMATRFLATGVETGQRCLFLCYEESRKQLFRNAAGWGIDFARMEEEGKLRVVCVYPEVAGPEDHLIRIKEELDRFQPDRVAFDSLTALERVATLRGFREFVVALTSFIKEREIAGLFTATTSNLMGGTSVTEAHISTITDSIILLRYVEMFGRMRRGIAVLKMRGSAHDKQIREYRIDGTGMHVDGPFRSVLGILAGNPFQVSAADLARSEDLEAEGWSA